MSKVGLSTVLFDLQGFLLLQHDDTQDLEAVTRRVSKVATLDGGVSVSDLGYTSADRSLIISSDVPRGVGDNLIYMIKNHSDFMLTTREGAFIGKATRYTYTRGRARFEFTVTGDA